jgi:exosortase
MPRDRLGTVATLDLRADLIPVAGSAVLLVAYLGFFKALVAAAVTNPYAGHVSFVPVFAVLLLWLRRRDLLTLSRRNTPAGIGVVAAAMVVLAIGYTTASVLLQAVSFVAAVGGVTLWLFGFRGVQQVGFVLMFLLLMVPPPRDAVSALAPAVQQLVALFSGVVLRALQIPVEQQGILLYLPGMTLEVAEECAGLRFLPILFVFVAAFACAVLPTTGVQLVLISVSIPVAMLANAARVAATSAAAYAVGPHVVTGPAHYYIGKSFWALALLAMIGLAYMLRARATRVVSDAVPRPIVAAAP